MRRSRSRAGAVGRPAAVAALIVALGGAGCFAEMPGLLPRPVGADQGPLADVAIDVTVGEKDAAPFEMGLPLDMGPPGDMAPLADMPLEDMPLADMAFDDDMRVELGFAEDMALEPDIGPDLDMQVPDMGDMLVEPDLEPLPDLMPLPDLGPIEQEVCNGIDDNRDGIVDNAPVCGQVVAAGCRVYLGWAEGNAGPGDGSEDWGRCPDDETDDFDEVTIFDDRACRGTHGTGYFYRIEMPWGTDVDDDHDVGLAFRCPGAPPEVGQWYQRSCRVWIGQADRSVASAMDSWDDWGGCLAGSLEADWNCESSGDDGRFNRMSLMGDVNGDDAFAIAFRCEDPEDPARAEAATHSVAVILAWDDNGNAPGDGSESWGGCPGPTRAVIDNDGNQRCASSRFDGRFHRFETNNEVDENDAFGIALVPHPEAR